jgi:hypothetical protein
MTLAMEARTGLGSEREVWRTAVWKEPTGYEKAAPAAQVPNFFFPFTFREVISPLRYSTSIRDLSNLFTPPVLFLLLDKIGPYQIIIIILIIIILIIIMIIILLIIIITIIIITKIIVIIIILLIIIVIIIIIIFAPLDGRSSRSRDWLDAPILGNADGKLVPFRDKFPESLRKTTLHEPVFTSLSRDSSVLPITATAEQCPTVERGPAPLPVSPTLRPIIIKPPGSNTTDREPTHQSQY